MAKGSKRQRRDFSRSASKHKSNKKEDRTLREASSDDEIDAFHKQRDVVPLDVNDDDGSEDEDLEEPVFDFEGVDDDSDDSGSEDGDDIDKADDGTPPKGFAAKIARQAKYLKQKFGGGDDEMVDDQEEEEGRQGKVLWGRNKNLYYNADNIDYELQSSDEDLPKEEEDEVLRIQREKAKSLSMEDFGLEAAEDESDSDMQDKIPKDGLLVKGAMTKRKIKGTLEGSSFESYEMVKKDVSSLSKDEQMDIVYSSAPELVGLLSELNEALEQLENVKPALTKVKEENDIEQGKMQNLKVKQILLLTYCQAIGFYLLLKAEGHSIRDHPVITHLVEIKNMLEKMKQIDQNFPSQTGIVSQDTVNGFCNSKAEEMSPSDTTDALNRSAAADEISQVVILQANKAVKLKKDVSVKDDHQRSSNQKVKVVQRAEDVQMGLKSLEMLKVRENLEAKLKQKGLYNFTKSKPENLPSHASKPVNRNLETRDDFDDEVQQNVTQLSRLSQLVATKASKSKFASGDDDLPKRDNIGERRRKHELRVLARVGTKSLDDDDDDDNEDMEDGDGHLEGESMDLIPQDDETGESEDEFYKEVKRRRAEKLIAKEQIYSKTPIVPLLEENEADGKRQITYQMEKNRGLTRSRKKTAKIPRKKYKIKHQKAVVRRKGQVRDIRKPTGPYGGELSGINTNISRSVRFKS
ncbi:protein THALLO isoform X2 [Typha angustifolia]|uniref:protein THALLO isoform X2 n=1 Tax=Typha angustifolia TaxID=59011 RepID=UPI003C2B5705